MHLKSKVNISSQKEGQILGFSHQNPSPSLALCLCYHCITDWVKSQVFF